MTTVGRTRRIARAAAVTVIAAGGPQVTAVPPGVESMGEAPIAQAAEGLPILDGIMASLAELRGLAFEKPVPGRKQSPEEWERVVQHEIDTMFPPARRDGIIKGLVRLGMLAEPIDVGAEFKNALVTQAAGYYDPETDIFYYLVSEVPRELLETIAAHELVHALQDQHFDLLSLAEPIEALAAGAGDEPRNDDRLHALRFLVEGEATYVQMIWQMEAMAGQLGGAGGMGMPPEAAVDMAIAMMGGMDVEQMKAMVEMQREQIAMMGGDLDDLLGDAGVAGGAELDAQMAAMDDIPPYILEPLVAAYLRGAAFTMRLRQSGGWAAVDQAYRDLPVTTEQTLHPDKYIGERDAPTELRLPAPARAALIAEGWTQLDAAIHGEMLLDTLLRTHAVGRGAAQKAVAGWDGDVYYAFGRDDEVLIVLMTAWDSEDDAVQFLEAYRETLASKYPRHRVRPDPSPDGAVRFDTTDPRLGHGALVRSGERVYAVEGGSPVLVDRVLALLAAGGG
jgi:hypothetical protein